MAMLFTPKHSTIAQNIISLHHRGMVMPRCSSSQVYTLQGSDYETDQNVSPTVEK